MTFKEIASTRLWNQQVTATDVKKPEEVVEWMGAMQAQDYSMAKWAIGIRSGASDQMIEAAVAGGVIIRTHVLRPTWHFVSAKDIYWMLELTAPHIKASLRSRHRELALTEAIITKSQKVMEKALSGGMQLERQDLVKHLEKARVPCADQRLHHMLLRAELDMVICSGGTSGKKRTYALLAERVPPQKKIARDEALARLAVQYWKSHGPATLADFIWWSGLPAGDAKKALEFVKPHFNSEKIGLLTYYFADAPVTRSGNQSVYLLPAYDEFIISYKDRSACLSSQNHADTISSNGIFRPVIVVNGHVAGLWKRVTAKNKAAIETTLFSPASDRENKSLRKRIEVASARVTHFFEH